MIITKILRKLYALRKVKRTELKLQIYALILKAKRDLLPEDSIQRKAIKKTFDRFNTLYLKICRPYLSVYTPTTTLAFETNNLTAEASFAFHLAIYQEAHLEKIFNLLNKIDHSFNLYISIAEGFDEQKLNKFKNLNKATTIIKSLDLFTNYHKSFLPIFNEFSEHTLKHDLICHVHNHPYLDNLASDLPRYLFHYLFGSKQVINSALSFFDKNKSTGMLLPTLHPSLVKLLNNKESHLKIDSKYYAFPIASCFWLNIYSIKNLCLTDNQDQTLLTHSLTQSVISNGFSITPYKVSVPHNAISYYTNKRAYPAKEINEVNSCVKNYLTNKKQNNKIAVYTAISGDYDQLILPDYLDPNIDYYCFSDLKINGYGIFKILPFDFYSADRVKTARYIKTHPHKYFANYDYVVWIDSNIMIRGDIKSYIDALEKSSLSLSLIDHPVRSCVYQEAAACMKLNKDEPYIIDKQINKYKSQNYPKDNGLIETNIIISKPKETKIVEFFNAWWNEINLHSKRDQLSINFVLYKQNLKYLPMFSERYCARDHKDFALFKHGKGSGYSAPDLRIESNFSLPILAPSNKTPVTDIVICVHNALADVTACLNTVYPALESGQKFIIVDDGSNDETKNYLQQFAQNKSNVILKRNNQAGGYTKAANLGLKSSSADFMILLNSDTLVTKGWAKKLADVAYSNPLIGIVGPLSNAASFQSIPNIEGKGDQTAINDLPANITHSDLDSLCENWSKDLPHPTVPIVHGFCLCIKREVLDKIGYFDEDLFPNGYGEENDFCLRAADAGFDLKIAINTFVFHAKSKSYSSAKRVALMQAGAKALRDRHTEERVKIAINDFKHNPILNQLRDKAGEFWQSRRQVIKSSTNF